MSATRRLLALQRTLIPKEFSRLPSPVPSDILHTAGTQAQAHRILVLPDGGRVDVEQSWEPAVDMSHRQDAPPLTQVMIDSLPVSIVSSLDRPPSALIITSLGTPFEAYANHIPKYPILELRPPSTTRVVAVSDFWATVYALFVIYHHQEHIPILLSTHLENRHELENYVLQSGLGRKQTQSHGNPQSSVTPARDVLFLSRMAFWQGAGTVGYHERGWFRLRRPYVFPHAPSFTRNELVITSHPLRPPKPLPGELLYRRYCPGVKKTLDFRYFCLDDPPTGQVPLGHLDAFHRWQNNPRVSAGWDQKGSLEDHRKYITKVMSDPHTMPIIMSWDGEPMGYAELFWVKEDHLAQHMGGADSGGSARDWDQGLHVLVGEDKFRGQEYSLAWIRSCIHLVFLSDPRTERFVGEPRADNYAILQAVTNAGVHIETIFDFPYKRSALIIFPRDRFFKLDIL